MMAQYQALKASYPDALLFFRLGDFYEMFGEDAEVASRVLQITLTGRDAGGGERIPMCGVPHHSAEGYLATLVEAGYKVAVCEQLEDPKVAKGLVERDVIRVVTPGTLTSERSLAAGENRYLTSLCAGRDGFGLAVLDLSTGEFWCLEAREQGALQDELERLRPSEVLIDEALAQDARWRRFLKERLGAALSEQPRADFAPEAAVRRLCEHFDIVSLEGCGCADRPLASGAAACALAYVERTQKTTLAHIARLSTRVLGEAMHLDGATRRALELTQTLRDNQRRGSLLWVLDATVTALGARTLRRWLEAPLTDAVGVRSRLNAVAALHADPLARAELRSALGRIYDIERLLGKAACRTAGGRDLAALRDSLATLPQLRTQVLCIPSPEASGLAARIDPHEALHAWLERALVQDPPMGVQEGGLIKSGYDAAIDELREVAHGGKEWLSRFEQQERETTGIKSLKVGYNKVFGYYIEVTRANLGLVPEHYLRKQTLAGGERFVTEALKERESLILGAEERLIALEYERFNELRTGVADTAATLQETARALGELDALCSLAHVAQERRYVKPEIVDDDLIEIIAGRHPVVEALQPDVRFVPNDCRLGAGRRTLILTGPNMAGKSTYLRQVALIGLMAQVGSFVPAEGAKLGIIDRIFTRVGASDDIGSGHSTFMVESLETANILQHATRRSLVLIDELGRGTSTYDGVALAQAVTEHLHEQIGSKAIVSTHYLELTELTERLAGAHNLHVAAREEKGRVTFLYQVEPGAADRSYGINVARMAGLPDAVIRRARQVLRELESMHHKTAGAQLSFFDLPMAPEAAAASDDPYERCGRDIAGELLTADPNSLTPLEALGLLDQWQRRLKAAKRDG